MGFLIIFIIVIIIIRVVESFSFLLGPFGLVRGGSLGLRIVGIFGRRVGRREGIYRKSEIWVY